MPWQHQKLLYNLLFLFISMAPSILHADTGTGIGRQDDHELIERATQFLQQQTAKLPNKARIEVLPPDARLTLTPCSDLQPFMTGNNRLWGRTLIGVRCKAPKPWTVYLQATIHITGQYLVNNEPMHQGHIIKRTELGTANGELTHMPVDTLTDPQQAIGKMLLTNLATGSPLRANMLRTPNAIEEGEIVTVIARGNGFNVNTSGRAITSAQIGHPVEVRMPDGKIIDGIATEPHTVLIRQ